MREKPFLSNKITITSFARPLFPLFSSIYMRVASRLSAKRAAVYSHRPLPAEKIVNRGTTHPGGECCTLEHKFSDFASFLRVFSEISVLTNHVPLILTVT